MSSDPKVKHPTFPLRQNYGSDLTTPAISVLSTGCVCTCCAPLSGAFTGLSDPLALAAQITALFEWACLFQICPVLTSYLLPGAVSGSLCRLYWHRCGSLCVWVCGWCWNSVVSVTDSWIPAVWSSAHLSFQAFFGAGGVSALFIPPMCAAGETDVLCVTSKRTTSPDFVVLIDAEHGGADRIEPAEEGDSKNIKDEKLQQLAGFNCFLPQSLLFFISSPPLSFPPHLF